MLMCDVFRIKTVCLCAIVNSIHKHYVSVYMFISSVLKLLSQSYSIQNIRSVNMLMCDVFSIKTVVSVL